MSGPQHLGYGRPAHAHRCAAYALGNLCSNRMLASAALRGRLAQGEHLGGAFCMIDDAAIQKRAKQLCEMENLVWDHPTFAAIRARGGRLKPVLDHSSRRDYLTRARAQLLKETGGLCD